MRSPPIRRSGGFDKFDYELVERVLGDYVALDVLKAFAGSDTLNMARLALNLSGYVNGVARRHAETARKLFRATRSPPSPTAFMFHGWTHAEIAKLYEGMFPNWAHEPEVLAYAGQVEDDALWNAHQKQRDLISQIVRRQVTASSRRAAARIRTAHDGLQAPRAHVLGHGRLGEVARAQPFQIVLAGLAHPNDRSGQDAIKALGAHISQLGSAISAVFVPGYNLDIAAALVAGCDVWLNTPLPPLEASGTSGMKAALNGVLNLSVLDGWWIEGCVDGVTGWSIASDVSKADDARALYDKLQNVVLPLYYGDRGRWIWMMKQSISKVGPSFNSHRMMRRYVTEAYMR